MVVGQSNAGPAASGFTMTFCRTVNGALRHGVLHVDTLGCVCQSLAQQGT